MLLASGFVLRFNPLLLEIFGIKIWCYGLAYALGFLGVYLWFLRARHRLGWRSEEVLDLVIVWVAFVLGFGRAFDIAVYEWDYYRHHLSQLLSFWGGGMASHGVLLGALVGTWLFSRARRKSFVLIADELVIPAAFFLGLGRIANFLNGQIYGSITSVWWAVKFPQVDGFRHPVALYESAKNFLLIPILFVVGKRFAPGRGLLFAHFILWYGFLRLFTDYFRDYGSELLGIGTGQYFNLLMAVCGLGLIVWFSRSRRPRPPEGEWAAPITEDADAKSVATWDRLRVSLKTVLFVALLLLSLTIPGAWTQEARLWLR